MKSILTFLLLHLYTQLVLCPAHILFGLLTGLVNPYLVTRHLCKVLAIDFHRVHNTPELV